MSLIAFLCLQDVILCINGWNSKFIQKIQWIVCATLLKGNMPFFQHLLSIWIYKFTINQSHCMNSESCMHLFRLSMIPEIYCQFCFLPCTMSKSPVKVIIMTIIYLTTQTRCFVFLPCVYMHEHIMYRKYAASDALNGIEICHLKSFQEKNF